MHLDQYLRRVSTYLYVQNLLQGAVVELGPEDGRSAAVLVEHGADSVVVVGAAAKASVEGAVTVRPGAVDRTGLSDQAYDLVIAPEIDAAALPGVLAEAKRLLRPDGRLVIGCESRDRPGAQRGISYYDLVDQLDGRFAAVSMVGLAPFAATTLVEYGVTQPEPVLDGSLVMKGERVEWYIAVAGKDRVALDGYAVIQVPLASVEPTIAQAQPAKSIVAPAAARGRKSVTPPFADDEARQQLAARMKAIEEFQQAAIAHAKEMTDARAALSERDAYIAELEAGQKGSTALIEAARRAEARAEAAEAKERQARLLLAEAQGRLLGGRAPDSTISAAPTAPATDAELAARVAALEAENAKLKIKEADARSESWKHLKARSEAEKQAADVREDTVRKLKDARKLASVELTRAMEEATRKAVSLRDELARTERERKQLIADLKQAREEIESVRAQGSAPEPDGREVARLREESEAAVLAVRAEARRSMHDEETARAAMESQERLASERLDAQRGRLLALERELAEAQRLADGERERSAQLGELVRKLERELAEARELAATGAVAHGVAIESAKSDRERFGRLLTDVEREAKERADSALRMRNALTEREREVALLRRELSDRDAKLTALERRHPPQLEIERMEAELATNRQRLTELGLELHRREAAVERAAAAAAHERARSERLIAEERRALQDRNDARSRAAEAESRASALVADKERLERDRELESERARKAESDARDRKERVKQLKRELEEVEKRALDAERRAEVATRVQIELGDLEQALRGEEQRMAAMEEALRRAAAQTSAAPRAE